MALPPWLLQKLQMGGGFMPMPGGMPGAPPPWSTPPIMPATSRTQAPAPLPPPTPPPTPSSSGPRFQGPAWLQKAAGGFNNFMGGFAGPDDPNLSPQENAARRQHAQMAMQAQLLQAARPRPQGTGSPVADFGAAMQASQQAGGQFTADALRAKLMQAQTAQAQAAANQQDDPTYASPIGKLLADRDLAEQRNDTVGVAAIDQAIAKESGMGGAELAEVLRVRNDITRNSTEFLNAQTGYDKVIAASKSDSPAGDMSLIFGFMKVLDPGSIVKEGEFATVQNSAGIPEQIRGVYNRLLRGERLTPEQRKDFTYQARQQFEPLIKRQQGLVKDAQAFAERNKLPFADIVPEYLMPLLPEAIDRPPASDPAAQLPTLWGQIKDDFSGMLGRFKSPADMTDEEIEAELKGLDSAGPR